MENKENKISETNGIKSDTNDETQAVNEAKEKNEDAVVVKEPVDSCVESKIEQDHVENCTESRTDIKAKVDEIVTFTKVLTIQDRVRQTDNDQSKLGNNRGEQTKAACGQTRVSNVAVHPRSEKRKIFVGGIASMETDASLSAYFSQFGEVESVEIKVDNVTLRPRGFAFVEFKTVAACQAALKVPLQTINTKMVEIRAAKAQDFNNKKKLFVGGLPQDLRVEDLIKHFEAFGVVEDVEWPIDRLNGSHRNFAFVIFNCETSVGKALSQPKQTIGGRLCDVKRAVPQQKRTRDLSFLPDCVANGMDQRNLQYLRNNFLGPRPQLVNGQPWPYAYPAPCVIMSSGSDSNITGPDHLQNRHINFYPMDEKDIKILQSENFPDKAYDPSRITQVSNLPPQQQISNFPMQNHLPGQEIQNTEQVQFH